MSLSEAVAAAVRPQKLSEKRKVSLPPIELTTHAASYGSPLECVNSDYQSPSSDASGVVVTTIFLCDGKAVQFRVIDGKRSTTSRLLSLIASHCKVDGAALKETCSLWMVCSILEIQLKSHHIPYCIARDWSTVLKRFTNADGWTLENTKPILVLRRRVYLSIERELELAESSEWLTEMLYASAKEEVLSGRYMCDVETAIKLAALQMALEYGHYDENEHTIMRISEEVPFFFAKRHVSSVKTASLLGHPLKSFLGREKDLLDEFKRVVGSFKTKSDIRKNYLDIVRRLPYYGAAFFTGEIERRPPESVKDFKKFVLYQTVPMMKVCVGVSDRFFTVASASLKTELLVLPRSECHYQNIGLQPDGSSFGTPGEAPASLLLEFTSQEEENSTKENNILQIFTPQAVFITALLDAFAKSGNSSLRSSEDSCSDGASSSSCSPAICKRDKFCMASYSPEGKFIGAQGSLRTVLQA
ncbi:hypothetical protein AB6A40_002461 [Gnathostoma spinigerum]|uniref:FERM domain-containing protein 8 n=1 Tax=Gnathostoma spinigerum TaxID=75299 RepID=A0ABD6EGE8_9BILA